MYSRLILDILGLEQGLHGFNFTVFESKSFQIGETPVTFRILGVCRDSVPIHGNRFILAADRL